MFWRRKAAPFEVTSGWCLDAALVAHPSGFRVAICGAPEVVRSAGDELELALPRRGLDVRLRCHDVAGHERRTPLVPLQRLLEAWKPSNLAGGSFGGESMTFDGGTAVSGECLLADATGAGCLVALGTRSKAAVEVSWRHPIAVAAGHAVADLQTVMFRTLGFGRAPAPIPRLSSWFVRDGSVLLELTRQAEACVAELAPCFAEIAPASLPRLMATLASWAGPLRSAWETPLGVVERTRYMLQIDGLLPELALQHLGPHLERVATLRDLQGFARLWSLALARSLEDALPTGVPRSRKQR